MSTPRVTDGVGPAPAVTRRPLLAAGLLAGAGLLDLLGALAATGHDAFMLATRRGVYEIDITGWAWSQAGVSAATVLAALLVLTGRRWAALVGLVAAAVAIAADLVIFPFAPWRAALAIGLNIAAIRLLLAYRRPRSPN
ncbi:hypothetical protein [Micromonospora sp. NPDC049497]|uniref:DUF7144 family membrane protein n=1 Tax=Micromonospora sp. NPDC049497 TaxID=3364273 RepID=UPI003789F6CF